MNEGFASMTHYQILNVLHDQGLTTDGAHLEFLAMHANVLYQPAFDSRHYSGINPYAFGFAMLRDIQRMCEHPTDEDLRWFPRIRERRAQDLILESVEDFRDESFIRQWLSPRVIRDLHLFSIHDDRGDEDKMTVGAIHNERGYETIRENLADQYLRASMVPHLEVVSVDKRTRTLGIEYNEHRGRKLGNIGSMMPHLSRLWGGYPVIIRDQRGNLLASSD
jgi:spore cortex formation protein SpoVR/YcgB (stage V sporulation)